MRTAYQQKKSHGLIMTIARNGYSLERALMLISVTSRM